MAQRSIAVAVLAAVALTASGAPPAAGEDRIAYTAVSDGVAGQLLSVAPDGSGRLALTDPAQSSTSPAFSPDGARLAFGSDRDYRPSDEEGEDLELPGDIYTMPFDGGEARRLTSDPGYEDMPAWSPGGDQIAFTRLSVALTGISGDLWAMAADGSNRRQLTVNEIAFEPAWSPDGLSIAYTSLTISDDGERITTEVRTVPAAGGASRALVANAYSPAFSPDGTLLAYASNRDGAGRACARGLFGEEEEEGAGCTSDLFVARADGSEPRRLTDDPGDDGDPSFAPDGRRIVFASDRFFPRAPSYDLWTVRVDGSCPTRITASAAEAVQPAWRPHARGGGGPLPPLPLPTPPVTPPAGGECVQPALDYAGPSLAPARRWRGSRPLWTGTAFRGLALSAVAGSRGELDLVYADCVEPSGNCGEPFALVHERCPDALAHRSVVRRYRSRGAIVTLRRRGVVELLSGGLAVHVDVGGPRGRAARAREVIAALRTFGAERRGRRLPAPALRPSVLRELRAAVVAVRRHGLSGASRRLAVPRRALRDRLALARALRGLPRPAARDRREAASCDRRAQRKAAGPAGTRRPVPVTQPGWWRWLR